MSEAPDLIRPVVGFRTWNVEDEVWLASTAQGQIWRRGEHSARCLAGAMNGPLRAYISWAGTGTSTAPRAKVPPRGHTAPHEDCTCGFYACHTVEDALEHFKPDNAALVGVIAATGRLCAHKTGFRAERAKVVLLAYRESRLLESRAEYVARAYDAEVVPFDLLEEAAARYGDPVPDGLLPEGKTKENGAGSYHYAHGHFSPDFTAYLSRVYPPKRQNWLKRKFA